MARPTARLTHARPIGAFAALAPVPHALSETVHREQLDAMTSDPGLRLASGTGRRRWRGGAVTVQRFVRANGEVNSEEALEAPPIRNSRRTSGVRR